MDSKDTLNDFVNKNSKYFVLPDDVERQVTYLSAEVIPNRFDNGKTQCMRYVLDVDGTQQNWDRGSRSLAQQMADIPEGSLISIRKTGSGNKTKYFVNLVR
ncbi:hypothetical protein ACFL0T_06390 [Candidatus Omnitrophota bacterium]